MRLAGILDRVKAGAKDAYGEGREDNRRAFMNAREDKDLEAEPTRIESMLGQNRTLTALREMFGVQPENPNIIDKIFKADPKFVEARRQMGMNLSNDPATRAGQLLGHLGADLTQDRSREVWWLLNAPQAVGNVANEFTISKANPSIFNKRSRVPDSMGNDMTFSSPEAVEKGIVDDASGRLKKGYSIQEEGGEKYIVKRKFKEKSKDE